VGTTTTTTMNKCELRWTTQHENVKKTSNIPGSNKNKIKNKK
jgi:hypothetical protein